MHFTSWSIVLSPLWHRTLYCASSLFLIPSTTAESARHMVQQAQPLYVGNRHDLQLTLTEMVTWNQQDSMLLHIATVGTLVKLTTWHVSWGPIFAIQNLLDPCLIDVTLYVTIRKWQPDLLAIPTLFLFQLLFYGLVDGLSHWGLST